MKSSIYLRAHTEVQKSKVQPKRKQKSQQSIVERWAEFALVVDTETTIDEKQSLTFGFYRLLRNLNGAYSDVREEGIFYPEQIDQHSVHVLTEFAKAHPAETAQDSPRIIRVRTLPEFIEKVFMPNALAGAVVVGFNLPFDLARIAVDARAARRLNEDWSLLMATDHHPVTGELRENPFVPRIKITRKDGKFAFIRFAGVSMRSPQTGKRFKPFTPGRFLDLRTLLWALRNVTFDLKKACKEFGSTEKSDHTPSGRLNIDEVLYCRQDVRATVGLLNALRTEFDSHPIDLRPEKAYSPASIAKAYLRAMGLVPPLRKFRFTSRIQGIAAQAYFGGRAEARIRRTVVPTVCTDFKSEYPTVNTLMGLWALLTAETVQIKTSTDRVRTLLASVGLKDVFEQSFWKKLSGYALVMPDQDVLPVRTRYNGESNNVGVNPLTSEKPLWFAIPDLVAATLLTGKPPKVLKAFDVIPEGQQVGLKPVALRGRTVIDPQTDDFFKAVIEARERLNHDTTIAEAERKALGYFLKILANSGSYGLFIETTPKRVAERERLDITSGESSFSTTSEVVEDKGTWYCPVISSLITSGGRLLLAMLEKSVTDAGSSYLFCDTDSMAFVSSEHGGLVPCVGGRDRLPDGSEAVKALSWGEAQGIVSRFEELNPYAFTGSILKVEKESLSRSLLGYAVSTKRYCLFTQERESITIATASSHGLGYLFVPESGFNEKAGAPSWVVEAWEYILSSVLGFKQRPCGWFGLPAMMRIGITTPRVLIVLQTHQENWTYADRHKPFGFVLSPQVQRIGLSGLPKSAHEDRFTLIAPFTKDSSRWMKLPWTNLHDGRRYGLAPITEKTDAEASPQLLEDVILLYQVHPESKSLAPDGSQCDWHTQGLLQRTSVIAVGEPQFIGKETDRRWEHEEDISVLLPILPLYRPNETEKLVTDSEIQSKIDDIPVRKLARIAKLSPTTIQAIKDGRRIRKSTSRKIRLSLLRTGKRLKRPFRE
jgi:hypothetical protein